MQNMIFKRKLPIPKEIKEQYPLTAELAQVKARRDKEIADVFTGKSGKMVLIIGPCSADREDAVLEYCERLAKLQEAVSDKLVLIPRVYTNKPRTTGDGYKGLLHQPDPRKTSDMLEGVIAIRRLHTNVLANTGLPTADEMLYPDNYRYLSDLLSYVAVGARSVENQEHRLTSSGIDIPVGMKNPTSGDISVMLNSIMAAQHPHTFIYRGWEVDTTGNPLAHAILRGYVNKHGESMPNYHFEELERLCNLVHDQLLERLEIISNKKVYNFPFLMGEGVWIDSEKLGWTDSVREVLKHGTLSIGFIGLAEALVALRGKHHGEDPASQNLGLEIVGFIRNFCDECSQREKLNYTCLATPAEGLSGRFVRIDKEKYGIIPGVTDREYYTNSFHVPVYYPISAFEKIAIEAPYHALTNAGHISYIEMDGDPSENLEAFEKVIRCMKENGIGYGSVNHPVDRDPVCGFSGIIGDQCPGCGRHEDDVPFERIRRITGYLVGTLDRFNNAKRAEERDRVKHSV